MNYEEMSKKEIEEVLNVLASDLYEINGLQDCLYKFLGSSDVNIKECRDLAEKLKEETRRVSEHMRTLSNVVFSKHRYMKALVSMMREVDTEIMDS